MHLRINSKTSENVHVTNNEKNENQIVAFETSNIQLLDETEKNIVIYQWRADQLFANAEGRGK